MAPAALLWSESIDVDQADPVEARKRSPSSLPISRARVDADGAPGARRQSDNLSCAAICISRAAINHQRTEDSLQQGRRVFREGGCRSTQFSLAHSGLADAHGLLAHYGVLGPADVWAKAASSAASAVMLDGHSAEAHTSLAHVRATQDWDFASAEHLFQKAIQLNPRYSTARHWYAMSCLVPMARLDEALEQILIAQSLDPVSAIIARDVAVIQYYRRDFDAALEQCDHTIELNPHFAPAYLTLGLIQEQRKELDEAAAAFAAPWTWRPKLVTHAERAGEDIALRAGRSARSKTLAKRSKSWPRSDTSRTSSHDDRVCRSGSDAGYRWLSKACDDPVLKLLTLKADPRFDAISNDPRFAAVTGRVGLS